MWLGPLRRDVSKASFFWLARLYRTLDFLIPYSTISFYVVYVFNGSVIFVATSRDFLANSNLEPDIHVVFTRPRRGIWH